MIILMQHPKGPKIAGKKTFKSYVALADYADQYLPYGLYFARHSNAVTLAGIREIRHEEGLFHVEGYGNV